IVDVDRQRGSRQVTIAIPNGIDEDVLSIGIDNVWIGCVAVGTIRMQHQLTVLADDLSLNSVENSRGRIATRSPHADDSAETIRTDNVIPKHAERIADQHIAFGD